MPPPPREPKEPAEDGTVQEEEDVPYEPKFEDKVVKQNLVIESMCRNDGKLLHYQLDIELNDTVAGEPISYFQIESVGRLFVSL